MIKSLLPLLTLAMVVIPGKTLASCQVNFRNADYVIPHTEEYMITEITGGIPRGVVTGEGQIPIYRSFQDLSSTRGYVLPGDTVILERYALSPGCALFYMGYLNNSPNFKFWIQAENLVPTRTTGLF